jgi:hypothetical protein
LKPLLAAGLVDLSHGIVCDSKSGVSGAGKAPVAKTHFMYAADNLSAYGVFAHRHTGELLEQLGVDAESLTFTPHLLPIPRGILVHDLCAICGAAKQCDSIEKLLRGFLSRKPDGSVVLEPALPQIQYSVRTNYADIGFNLSNRRAQSGDCKLPGQPAQRRGGAGRSKFECHAGLVRGGGSGMKYVIKLGGAGLENPTLLQGCVRAIANLVQDGNQVAVVHGGGIQLTKTLAQLGKKSEFIQGLRVTDAETRDAALMVLAGRVNKGLWRRWGRLDSLPLGSPAATD